MKETRRNFLKTGFAAVAGAAAAKSIDFFKVKEAAAKPRFREHPYGWPLNGLDTDESRETAYEIFYNRSRFSSAAGKHCASAAFGSIVGMLQETFAHDRNNPYHNIPLSMMQWGAGGAAGFGSLCGALNGACTAIGLACSNDDAKKYISDLLTWYSETDLPIYPSPVPEYNHVQSAAGSNLCHVSVTNWCIASGYASKSPQRFDRCACLAADVASKTVEMLNSGIGGTLGNPRDNSTNCGQCHYMGTDFAGGQFTHGAMNCSTCHPTAHDN